MSTNETALILIQPDDSTDTVLEKMLSAGAASVQILVPDGAIGLRTVAQAGRLRQMAAWSWIDLTLVSSDPATIGAAWINQIQILVVCDTHVLATSAREPAPPASPPEPSPPASPPEPTDSHWQVPAITPARPRPQRVKAPGQRADRVIPRHDTPRLTRHEPARPRPRRSGGHSR